jgi:hypothetical protein
MYEIARSVPLCNAKLLNSADKAVLGCGIAVNHNPSAAELAMLQPKSVSR